jgi:hypothetical protein
LAGADGAILVQLPKPPPSVLRRFRKPAASNADNVPEWIAKANLRIWREYGVPNGRRYALLKDAS